jgi:predicted RNase H-like HicB family nuclease
MDPTQLTAVIELQPSGYYLAVCPELNVSSGGDDIEEAKRNLLIAMDNYLRTASILELKEDLGVSCKKYRVKRGN